MEWWPQKAMNTPVPSGDGAEGFQHWRWGGGRTPTPKHLSAPMTSQFHVLLISRDQASICCPLTCKLQSLCSWTWQESPGKKGNQGKDEEQKEGTQAFLLITFEIPSVNWTWPPGKPGREANETA